MNARPDIKFEQPPGISVRSQSEGGHSLPGEVKFRRILVPLDFSSTSAKGLRYAAQLGTQFGGSIWLIYVQDPISFLSGMEGVVLAEPEDESAKYALKLLGRLSRKALAPPRRGGTLVCIGQPVREIAEAARSLAIDVVVMTTHGYTGFRKMIRTSLAERLVRDSTCPVLTINEAFSDDRHRNSGILPITNWKKILVPVDFTKSALNALRYAIALAGETNARITLFHVVNMEPTHPHPVVINLGDVQKEMRRLAEHNLDVLAQVEIPDSVEFEKSVQIGGTTSEAIVQTARQLDSDLVVMGTHHYSWWRNLSQADNAERVVRTAPCPVLSVPEKAHPPQSESTDAESNVLCLNTIPPPQTEMPHQPKNHS
jgi:nucleotide-binding universal stress UspA family protein